MKMRFILPVTIIVLFFSNLTFADNESHYGSDSLFSVLSKAQELRDKIILEIEKINVEIQKNEEIIQKSKDIIGLAQEEGNTNAEMIAKDALMNAQEAKRRNEGTLASYRFYKKLLDNQINSLQQLTSTSIAEDCKSLEEQLERDKQALKNYIKTSELIIKENEEWGKEAKEGLKCSLEALYQIISLYIDRLLFRSPHFDKLQDKFHGLEKEIYRYLNTKTPTNKYLRDRLYNKAEKALEHYKAAYNELHKLKFIKETKTGVESAYDFYKVLKNTEALVKRYNELGNEEIMEISHDPEIRKLLSESAFPLTELTTHLTSLFNEFNEFADELDYIVSLMSFLDNSICTGSKYIYVPERLEQLDNLVDMQLKTFDSLKKRIEIDMKQLKECREKAQKTIERW